MNIYFILWLNAISGFLYILLFNYILNKKNDLLIFNIRINKNILLKLSYFYSLIWALYFIMYIEINISKINKTMYIKYINSIIISFYYYFYFNSYFLFYKIYTKNHILNSNIKSYKYYLKFNNYYFKYFIIMLSVLSFNIIFIIKLPLIIKTLYKLYYNYLIPENVKLNIFIINIISNLNN